MARVLLHSLVFAPDGVSTAYLMTDLARQLHRLGHAVTVLTTTPHYNLEAGALDRQRLVAGPRGLKRSQLDGVDVYHVPMPMKGEQVAGRMMDYLRFHGRSLAALGALGDYDIVIAPSPPLTIGAVAWLMARRRSAPAVYNVQEIYPDFAINQGLLSNPAMIWALRRLERLVYRRSAAIVPISEWFARIIRERGVPAEKIHVIPNFVDTELYCPGSRDNGFAREHGLVDRFVVLYGGNVGLSQDWEAFLLAAEQLRELPIEFVVVGGGAREGWVRAEVERRRLGNVRLLGYQPRERMPEINAASDLGTIPMLPDTTIDTFPSKIYTIFACARPALVSADPDSELAWICDRSGAGRVVPPGDAKAYVAAVRRAFEERDLLPAAGQRGRSFVEREYSKEAIGGRYDALIRSLVRS